MKQYIRTHTKLVGAIGAIGAIASFIIAIIYYFAAPEEASKTDGLQKLVLMYAHPLCWIFLCIASLLWAFGKAARIAVVFAYAALGVYAAFVVMLLVAKAT